MPTLRYKFTILIRFAILPNEENDRVAVKELPDRIIFLHQVQPGGESNSYGIEAGRLVGLATKIIERLAVCDSNRAHEVMAQIEQRSKI